MSHCGLFGQVTHGVGLGESEDDRTEEGHRQADQPTDDRRRVGVDNEQREGQHREVPTESAIRMPANAASEQPSAQLAADERLGRPPLRRTSERFDTTARMATPVRVLNNSSRSPKATAIAIPMTMSWWYKTDTPKISTLLLAPKKGSTIRLTFGPQMIWASAINAEQDAHRHDRLDHIRRAFEPAHDDDIEEQPERRRQHEQDQRHAQTERASPISR